MKKNNKGSAFVMVLVILAIVGILAAVALWVSLVNYQMKLTDVKVKNNFYSAESVLDQICVGLQSDVSVAYERAYKTVSVFFSDMSDKERKVEFEKIYKKELKRRLKATDDASDMSYKIEKLKGYVYQNIQDSTKLPYAQVKVVDRVDSLAKNKTDGKMITYDNHIVLKGIEVTFTDEDGYTSIIETDISLNIPDMDFLTVNSMPNTLAYSLVGNRGVAVAGDTTINGSLYAGNTGNILNDVSLDISGAVTFEKSKYIISYGTTKINVAQGLKVNTDTQFWTQNIEVDGGQNVQLGANAILLGNTFVADDLTIKGVSPKVVLGAGEGADHFEGRYIGFGNSKDEAEKSSAIIINGTSSYLDISRLKDLKLSGYSFVNTDQVPANLEGVVQNDSNKDIRMGESIAVKSGQIAYLIPPECIGVDQNSGASMFNRNPLTYEEEKKIKEASSCKEVDGTTFSKQIGSSLDTYLGEDKTKDIMSIVSKVHVPKDGGLTYYYINLDQEQAARYFRNYQGGNQKARFELYTDFYTDKIQIQNDSSAVQTVGNYVSFDGEVPTISAPTESGLANEMTKYSADYNALKYILYPNSDLLTQDVVKRGSVFANLIDEAKFDEVLNPNSKLEVTYTDPSSEDNNMKAILVKGDYEYKSSDDPKGQVALIIATGTVKVDSNFQGSIIAKGKILIGMTAAKVSGRTIEDMRKLLKQEISSGKPLYQVFHDGENYLIGSVVDDEDIKKSDKIPYSDIITYQNWKMK